MSYEFEIIKNEKNMKNYYDNGNTNGKDTLYITIKNIGELDWEKNKGKIICVKENSNIFCETVEITEDVDNDDDTNIVLTFKRNEENLIMVIVFVQYN